MEKGNLASCSFPPSLELAVAYILPQVFRETYTLSEALARGTLFPELYRPYS